MSEAFVYLWYDASNRKYYLGKHKGSPDDKYTHSSTIWESFTKDNIPEGVTRRILAYGTDEEMCILEHKLLVNRKKRCWDRYYNESLGDPRYVDMSGENAWNWKGGITYDMKAYMKEYDQTPERVEYRMKYERRPERMAYKKEYRQTPEYKEKEKKRNQTPERKAYMREYNKKYDQRPERQDYNKKRRSTPEYKAYMREWRRKDYAKKKAEKQGEGTLDAFLK